MEAGNNRGAKLWMAISIVLLLLCILLTAVLGVLYVKRATPQTLLSVLGFHIPEETNWTLASWHSSIEQMDYDSDIVFIGDSLTRGENFQKYFPDKKIINLGLSRDSVSGISRRTYIIGALAPEKIFVEGGVNNLRSYSVDSIATQYESMIVAIMAYNPGDEVYIQSVLPISNKRQRGGLTNENIVKLNAKLQEIAEKHGATYIDIYSSYVLNGEMNPEYTSDGVHLREGYKHLWLESLSEYVYQ